MSGTVAKNKTDIGTYQYRSYKGYGTMFPCVSKGKGSGTLTNAKSNVFG